MDRQAKAESGLLEQAVLLVRAEPRRRVLLTEAGEVVGHTGWHREGWLRRVLALYEQEQSPLVCTVRRWLGWPPRREVRDAEGELVGYLAGTGLLDRWERVAIRRAAAGFVDDRDQLLARWDGRRLELLDGVRHDPFAKMLIVAAVVAP
ncbi:MAG: hypothetical protein U0797_02900 [Gemmataceae bacterium]